MSKKWYFTNTQNEVFTWDGNEELFVLDEIVRTSREKWDDEWMSNYKNAEFNPNVEVIEFRDAFQWGLMSPKVMDTLDRKMFDTLFVLMCGYFIANGVPHDYSTFKDELEELMFQSGILVVKK